MPASLRFLDDDEVTPITTLSMGNVATPGTTSGKKLFVENFGDEDATSLAVAIEQVGTSDGDDYAQLAPDSGGSPGTWVTTPLSFGTLVAGDTAPFWLRDSVPAGRTADNNPRRFDLAATALST